MIANGTTATTAQLPQLKTPVAFFVFNRPDTTARVFEAIRRAAPSTLLVVADGPRPERPDEADRCGAVREIVSRVDWPCRVLCNYSEENLGCRRRMSSGLDWVFDQVEEAIILEDDCLPDQSFFLFCQELLERYRDDGRVMMISGDNFHARTRTDADSYYFSRYPHIWGWASWRKAWLRYDVDMKLWPRVREQRCLDALFPNPRQSRFWQEAFDGVHRGDIDTWDHQFTFSCLINNGLCVLPAVNLVSNLGFGPDATHTRSGTKFAEMPTQAMTFPLRHPLHMIRDACSDRATEKEQFQTRGLFASARSLAHRILRGWRGPGSK